MRKGRFAYTRGFVSVELVHQPSERQSTMITLNGIEIEVSEFGVCQCWDCDRGKPWKCANEEEEE